VRQPRYARGVAITGVVAAVAAAVLAYGYWFGATHGAVYFSVLDVSDRDHIRDLSPVSVSLLDESGAMLAKAQSIPPTGTIFLTSPERYACHEVESRASSSDEARRQWSDCFERQSRWVPTWIRRVRAVAVESGACTIDRMPATVLEHPDTWWLWWVPLRHIGGKPYTSFTMTIEVDRRSRCDPRASRAAT